MTNATLRQRFRNFAAECRGSSPLYERLALGVAEDEQLLALAAAAQTGQPPANMLFGAVHGLLLAGDAHPLAEFYPSLAAAPDPGDPLPAFRDFCLARADAVRAILASRTVQTNEVRRSALLVPAIVAATAELPAGPLAIVEVGASAGLNLLWDRYGYRYGAACLGDQSAPLVLACEPRGAALPLPAALPEVAWRLGLDLAPLDVADSEAVAWLRALIWPEHAERVARLKRALALARQAPPPLLAGDALDLLPEALGRAPAGLPLVVYDTFTINQLTPAGRARLDALLADHAATRPLARVSVGWQSGEGPTVQLVGYSGGRAQARVVATCHPHGAWIAWGRAEAAGSD